MPGRRLAAIAAATVGVTIAAYAARRLDAVAVRGGSMVPALQPGDRLLLARLGGTPRVGQVVVVTDPRDPARELVKRVSAVRDDEVTLLGDNPARSTDARTFGAIRADAVRWRVIVRYWPPSRLGPISSVTSTGSEPAAHALRR